MICVQNGLVFDAVHETAEVMDILIEIIAEFFTTLFGEQANKLGADREVPKWVKILFLIFALAFIAGILYFCWRLSE